MAVQCTVYYNLSVRLKTVYLWYKEIMAYSYAVQISNMQYAFWVQMYGEVLYLKFYIVFSEPLMNNEVLPEAAWGGEGDAHPLEN